MHRTIKPHPHHLRDASCIVAVRFVDLRLQRRLHVPRLDADHRQARFGKYAEQPLRQRPGFQPNPLELAGGVRQHGIAETSVLCDVSRMAQLSHFPRLDELSHPDVES